MKKSRNLFLIMVLAVVLVLTACAGETKDANEDKSKEAVESGAKGSETTNESEEKRTFAIVYPIIHPFFEATNQGAKDAGQALGVDVLIQGPDIFDVQKQIEIVENLISMNVDGFGIGATDAQALKPLIDKAMEEGIMVVTFDTDSPESKRLAYIGTDNTQQGHDTGAALARLLDGKGKVLVSMGVPSQLNLSMRLDGLKDELSQYPDIEIVDVQPGNGDPVQTSANIENMITAHPDFDALVGIDAQAGPSAVPIWESKGLTQVLVVPEDMPMTIQGVRNGSVSACIAQEQYTWGKLIIEKLDEACDGKALDETYPTGTIEITSENVDEKYPE